jgi:hypothetical protein
MTSASWAATFTYIHVAEDGQQVLDFVFWRGAY